MCYVGGPRCPSSAIKRLRSAKESGDTKLIRQATYDFYLTSVGIEQLRKQGKREDADAYQGLRDERIAASKGALAHSPLDEAKASRQKLTKVYRAGSMTPPSEHKPAIAKVVDALDAYVPEGRQTRHGGIFASPDFASHGRWLRGSQDKTTQEITVDENKVFVYSVDAYEHASTVLDIRPSEADRAAREFWDSGMTLAEWREWAKENKPEPGSWEIIMSPEAVVSVSPVSNRRVIESVGDSDTGEVNWMLEPRRASKGLIWRKVEMSAEDEQILVDQLSSDLHASGTSEADAASLARAVASAHRTKTFRGEDMRRSWDAEAQVASAINRALAKEAGAKPKKLPDDEERRYVSAYLSFVDALYPNHVGHQQGW